MGSDTQPPAMTPTPSSPTLTRRRSFWKGALWWLLLFLLALCFLPLGTRPAPFIYTMF